jgi:diacylglycerol kinase (ATP)
MDTQSVKADQMPWVLIANPSAGSGRCRRMMGDFETELLMAKIPYRLVWTEHPGHAMALAREWAENGHRRFMVAGGDGSLHEVLNGLMACPFPDQPIFTLASVPMGTANDWARYYGILHARDLIRVLQSERYSMQDLGKVQFPEGELPDRWFINVLGIGFDAYVADKLMTSGKAAFGKLSYLWMLFKCLLTFKSPALQLSGLNLYEKGSFFTVNLGITPYSGNKMQTVPHADPCDGQLALTRIYPMKVWEVILQLPRLYDGSLGKHKKVSLSQISELTVGHSGEIACLIEADGEMLGSTPCTISCIPQKIRVPDGRKS